MGSTTISVAVITFIRKSRWITSATSLEVASWSRGRHVTAATRAAAGVRTATGDMSPHALGVPVKAFLYLESGVDGTSKDGIVEVLHDKVTLDDADLSGTGVLTGVLLLALCHDVLHVQAPGVDTRAESRVDLYFPRNAVSINAVVAAILVIHDDAFVALLQCSAELINRIFGAARSRTDAFEGAPAAVFIKQAHISLQKSPSLALVFVDVELLEHGNQDLGVDIFFEMLILDLLQGAGHHLVAVIVFLFVPDPDSMSPSRFSSVGTVLNVFVGLLLSFFLAQTRRCQNL